MPAVDPVTIALTVVFWGSFGALLLCACCIVRYSMRWSNNGLVNRPTTATLTLPIQKNDTLHQKLINQFKEGLKKISSSFGKENSPTDSSEGCPICFDEYSGLPQEIFIGYIEKCGHYFHFDCIWKWLEARASCPLCREKVKLTEEDIKGLALSEVPKTRSMPTMTDAVFLEISLDPDTDKYSFLEHLTILLGSINKGSHWEHSTADSETEVTEGRRSVGSITDDLSHDDLSNSNSKQGSCGQTVSINGEVQHIKGEDVRIELEGQDDDTVVKLDAKSKDVMVELEGHVNDAFEIDLGEETTVL